MNKPKPRPLISTAKRNYDLLRRYHSLKTEVGEIEKIIKEVRDQIFLIVRPDGENFKYDSVYCEEFVANVAIQTNHYWDEDLLKKKLKDEYEEYLKTYKSKTVTFPKLSVKRKK